MVAVVLDTVVPAMVVVSMREVRVTVVLTAMVLVIPLFAAVVFSAVMLLGVVLAMAVVALGAVMSEIVASEGVLLVVIANVVSVSPEPSVEMTSAVVLYCPVELAVARWFVEELLLPVVTCTVPVVIAWVIMA